MGNVIRFDRTKFVTALNRLGDGADQRAPDQLAAMSYAEVIRWAGSDFDRLAAVAKARDYRPEWIGHQRKQLSPQQADMLAQMIEAANAVPYLTPRQRWVMRQLRIKPLSETELMEMAERAPEYEDCKYTDKCVRNDTVKLVKLGIIELHDGFWVRSLSRHVTEPSV